MADARMADEFSSELAAFFPLRSRWTAEKKAIEAHFARRCQRRATGHSHGTGECQRPHSHSSSRGGLPGDRRQARPTSKAPDVIYAYRGYDSDAAWDRFCQDLFISLSLIPPRLPAAHADPGVLSHSVGEVRVLGQAA